MNEELEVLEIVTQRLEKTRIPYMITGSIAANFYAAPRMTRDIDIVIEIQPPDVERLFKIFGKDFYLDRNSLAEAVEQKGMFNLIHNDYVVKIDFIVKKDSEYRELEFQRRREVQVKGFKMWIVSPEDLILSKLFWAKDSFSEMQQGDVKNLLAMVKDVDLAYLKKWVELLGLDEIYKKVNP